MHADAAAAACMQAAARIHGGVGRCWTTSSIDHDSIVLSVVDSTDGKTSRYSYHNNITIIISLAMGGN
jgi:hypothetical protein